MLKRLSTVWLMVLATIAVLASRRTSTLTTPYIWAEDGLDIVPQFVLQGWGSLLNPISGYIAFVPRLISYLALTVAPDSYPLASTLLAWGFMAGVMAFVALAPTLLRGRLFLAFACLLVPTDPEVFGTSLYSFWWAGLVLMLLILWERAPSHVVLRGALAVVCSLSTPITILIAPVMMIRAAVLRTRVDAGLAGLVLVCAVAQVMQIVAVQAGAPATLPTWHNVGVMLDKFFGRFVWGIDSPSNQQQITLAILGSAVAALAAWSLHSIKDRWLSFSLVYLLAASIAASVIRVDISLAFVGPTGGGPRYFFYPYIILAWVLIQGLYAHTTLAARTLFAAPLALAVINAVSSGWEHQIDSFSWRREALSCLHFEGYGMPVHMHGSRRDMFHGEYPRRVCTYVGQDMPALPHADLSPFSWRLLEHALSVRYRPRIIANSFEGNAPSQAPENWTLIGSQGSAVRTGSITFELGRDAYVYFKSGGGKAPHVYEVRTGADVFRGELPVCQDACTLAFTSDLLPEKFTVTFSDTGVNDDEWFAIGLPSAYP